MTIGAEPFAVRYLCRLWRGRPGSDATSPAGVLHRKLPHMARRAASRALAHPLV